MDTEAQGLDFICETAIEKSRSFVGCSLKHLHMTMKVPDKAGL